MVLLDDKGAKTNLSIDYYLRNRYFVLYESENQILLSKNNNVIWIKNDKLDFTLH